MCDHRTFLISILIHFTITCHVPLKYECRVANAVFTNNNNTKKTMHISRWQTFIGAVLLLLSGKLGWVEMSRITRYILYTASGFIHNCFQWL